MAAGFAGDATFSRVEITVAPWHLACSAGPHGRDRSAKRRAKHGREGADMSFAAHVMVVDGDPLTRDLLRAFLAAHGHDVAEFASLDAAVYRYRSERPAAVILDVATAGSIEALAEFKRIDRDVPVIVLSAPGRTTTVVQAMKLGASDVVGMPFEERD